MRLRPDNLTYDYDYYHSDHLGSASYITDLDGQIVQHIEYIPFGEVFLEERNNHWNTPYLFNGKELDDEIRRSGFVNTYKKQLKNSEQTGFYYYGARYYDPRVSQWLSVDPLAEQTLDPYGYCYQNPIKLIDPTGMGPQDLPCIEFSNKFVSNVLKGAKFSHYSDYSFHPGRLLSGLSPWVKNCWHAAARQVEYGGQCYTSQDLSKDRVNMVKLPSQNHLKVDVQKGVDLVIKNLNEGQSVVAGLDYKYSDPVSNPYNSNAATDHYVTIVGYGEDKKGFYFSYYDNAMEGGEKAGTDIINNRLYFNPETKQFHDEIGIHGEPATLSEVRDTKEKLPVDFRATKFGTF